MSWLRLTASADGYDILHIGHVVGDTFGPIELEVRDPDGLPVDLSAAAVRCELRKRSADPLPAATLAVALIGTHAVSLSLAAADTRDLPPGRSDTDPVGAYAGALRMTDALGRELTIARVRWQSLAD